MYLGDLPIGKMFETPGGTRGVLIECEINAKEIIKLRKKIANTTGKTKKNKVWISFT